MPSSALASRRHERPPPVTRTRSEPAPAPVQAHPGEREGDLGPAVPAGVEAGERRRLQRRVEQRRVEPEVRSPARLLLGEADLGVDRVAGAHQPPQALEGGPVLVAGLGQARVGDLGVDLLALRGRRRLVGGPLVGAQAARGVLGPLGVLGLRRE